jgi:hypothetical protein
MGGATRSFVRESPSSLAPTAIARQNDPKTSPESAATAAQRHPSPKKNPPSFARMPLPLDEISRERTARKTGPNLPRVPSTELSWRAPHLTSVPTSDAARHENS